MMWLRDGGWRCSQEMIMRRTREDSAFYEWVGGSAHSPESLSCTIHIVVNELLTGQLNSPLVDVSLSMRQ